MSDISKSNNPNRLDEKELDKKLVEMHDKKTLDERYQAFLDDVQKTTIETASRQDLPTDPSSVIPWKVAGIEFTSWEVEEKYGEAVYERACEEVPYEKVSKGDGNFYRMFSRDFSNAKRRLGHIIHEGFAA